MPMGEDAATEKSFQDCLIRNFRNILEKRGPACPTPPATGVPNNSLPRGSRNLLNYYQESRGWVSPSSLRPEPFVVVRRHEKAQFLCECSSVVAACNWQRCLSAAKNSTSQERPYILLAFIVSVKTFNFSLKIPSSSLKIPTYSAPYFPSDIDLALTIIVPLTPLRRLRPSKPKPSGCRRI